MCIRVRRMLSTASKLAVRRTPRVVRVAMLDRRRVIVIGAGIVLAILALTLGQAGAADLLIRNARLIDGTGALPRTGVAILVRDSRIAAIAPDLAAPESPLLDAGGATVLPGLIDAHVHLGVVPGSGQRHDPPDIERALRRWHLRAYLACGVTTVLDTSIAAATAREIQGWLRSGERGPRYLTLGPGLTTPGGYTPDVGDPVATPEDVDRKSTRLNSSHTVISDAGFCW